MALAFLALSLVRGLIYSAVVPPWQAPDEPQHMEYVKLVYQKGRLIRWRQDNSPAVEAEILDSMARHNYPEHGRYVDWGPGIQTLNGVLGGGASQLHQPPGAYLLYAAPLRLLSISETDVQLFAARLVSVILSSLVVQLALWTGYELYPQNRFLALGIPAFVLFLPAHAYMTSAVNNDHLAEVIVSSQVFLIVRGFRRGFTKLNVFLVGALIPIGFLTKRTVVYILPICALVLPLYFWQRKRYRVLKWGGAAALVLLLLAVPLALPAARSVQGLLVEHARGFYTDYLAFWPPFSPDQDYFGPVARGRYRNYVHIIFESFWARFGWMNVRLASGWYGSLLVVSLLALLGLGRRFLVESQEAEGGWEKTLLALFALGIASALLIIFVRQIRLWDYMPDSMPQGRYLFPLIIPIATLFVAGLDALLPQPWRPGGLWLLLGGLIVLDAVSLLGYVIPFFFS